MSPPGTSRFAEQDAESIRDGLSQAEPKLFIENFQRDHALQILNASGEKREPVCCMATRRIVNTTDAASLLGCFAPFRSTRC